MAWLPLTSTIVAFARLAIARWAATGIIWSSVTTRYQLGLVLHAGSLIAPLRAANPHGTWESAMNAAVSGSTSAANEERNFACRGTDNHPAAAESAAREPPAEDL